jgi:hypothetical protein
MAKNAKSFVSVHTLENTSGGNISRFIDDGQLIDDMNKFGLDMVISNKGTFDRGDVLVPLVEKSGNITFQPSKLGAVSLQAMHVRPIASIKRPGSEGIPILNPNNLKEMASNKYNLYKKVLEDYQTPMHLLPLESECIADMENVIDDIASDRVVIKSNKGYGGNSTKFMSKSEALLWLSREIESREEAKDYIVQPEIMFGRLPDGICAIGTEEEKSLVKKARKDELLTELRMFVVKRGANSDIIPILRIVPEKGAMMQRQNDVYVDVDLPDDLHTALDETVLDIMDRVSSVVDGGVLHAIGAVDFYFDKHSIPHVMEANFRSPQLPITRENPVAGRAIHESVAATLADMAYNNQRK